MQAKTWKKRMDIGFGYRLKKELDLQSLFGLHVHSCTIKGIDQWEKRWVESGNIR